MHWAVWKDIQISPETPHIYRDQAQCSSQVYVHDLHWNMQRAVYSTLLLLLLLYHYYYSTMKYVEIGLLSSTLLLLILLYSTMKYAGIGLHIAHWAPYLVRRSNLHLIASMCDQVLQIDWFNCWKNRLICTRRLSASHRAYCSWDVVFTNSDKKIILTNEVAFWKFYGKEKMPYIYTNLIWKLYSITEFYHLCW